MPFLGQRETDAKDLSAGDPYVAAGSQKEKTYLRYPGGIYGAVNVYRL